MSTFQVALAIHIVAMSAWVGGMILLVALVPALRRAIDAPQARRTAITAAAQGFNLVAWSGLVLAVFTGLWMILEIGTGLDGRLLAEKLTLVALSAIAAAVHAFWIGPSIRRLDDTEPDRVQRLRKWSGITGGIALVFAVAAVFAAVRLAGA